MPYLGNEPGAITDAFTQTFTGDGSETNFTLSQSSTTNAVFVRISGVMQRNGTDFTVSGTTLAFTTAPPAASNNIVVQFFTVGSIQTIADDAVATAKIADNAVTLAKLAGGTDGNLITFDASGDPAFVATGSSGQVLTSAGAGSPPTFGSAPGEEFLLYHHTGSSNSAGDTYSAGAFRTVTLDTEVYDTGNNGSLSTNVITLAAGTYRVVAYTTIASSSSTAYFAVRFRNTSDSSTVANGANIAVEQDRPVMPMCRNRFTISGSKNFELQVFPGTNNGYEFGGGPDNSAPEIFGVVQLTKEG